MNTDLTDIYKLMERGKRELLHRIEATNEQLRRLNENLERVENMMKEVQENESDADGQGRDGQGAEHP